MSVEALSDSELRTKLSEYGYPVGPVTQTTRKILVKKLKTLMESRGAAGSRHSMAARFSSDDTDDDTSATAKKKKKVPVNTRRQTLANPMPPPASAPIASSTSKSPTKKRPTKNAIVEDPDISDNDNLPSLVTRSPAKNDKTYVRSKRLSQNNDGLETGSDSDVVEPSPPKPSVVSKFGVGTSKSYNDRTPASTATPDVSSAKSYETNWRRTTHDSGLRSSPRASTAAKTERYSVNLPSKPLDSYKNDSQSTSKDLPKDDILSNYETPYLSEFTRRLSVQASVNLPSLSKSTHKTPKYRYTGLGATPEVKESESNGHFPRNTYPSSSSMTYVTSSLDKTRDKVYKSSVVACEEVKSNQNIISMVLVGVLALFFGGLAIVYMGLEGKTDSFPLLPADSDIPLCSIASEQDRRGANCIPEDIVTDVLQFIKQLHPILLKRAISAQCDSTKETPYISNNDIVTMFVNAGQSEQKVKENLYMAHVLLFRNPQWGMSLVDMSDEHQTPQVLDTMVEENVLLTRFGDKLGIVIQEPNIPWPCFIKIKLLGIASALLVAGFAALIVIGGQKAFVAYNRYKENAEKEVFNLVSEIISMLEIHHQSFATASPGGTQESYLAINHIRDNLIPPKDRKRLSGLWEKAVKFLDENESRIRREVQLVAGEEFQVWRWLPSNSNVPSSPGSSPAPKMSKVWQGSAFETMDGSVNSPACSPTPCLKIRHMFDPDVEFEDDWETKVKDAILEKSGDDVKILHIKVDRGSREGCVYLKCMSQEDAGKAYKALHGCWFDGHLVTVKYLRLERYHERFPDAVNFMIPLKPSNNQRLSMQAHSWTNSSEAN